MWKRDADQEYLQQHIEGAGRFDIRVVADKSSPLPLMLPSAEQFAEQVGKVGTTWLELCNVSESCSYRRE